MELQVGVKVLLKNREGKYLLMRRSPYEERGVGKWDIAGGRIEKGTEMMDNLAREVMEETGLTMKTAPKLLAAQDIIWSDRHVVRITYVADVDGEPTLSREHSEYGWFTFDDMRTLDNMDDYLKVLLDNGTIS
ncbi:MAG: NUDIX domain-containing protein [bacterium]|nr:NUDIX domain-containing protein [bacterium]